MKLVKYDQFLNENNDPFYDIFIEALTYITDEWTDWVFDIKLILFRFIIFQY